MVSTSLPAPAGSGPAGPAPGSHVVVLPLPPPRQPSPGATAPTDPRSGGGGGTEAQEAEQEASPAAAFSWGSGGRVGAASGAREPPPPGWGECAESWEAPRSGVPAPVPAFVSGAPAATGARDGASGGAASRGGSEGPATTPSLAGKGGQIWGQGRRRMVGIRVEREDRTKLGDGISAAGSATRRPAWAGRGAAAEGARVAMNDRPRQGVLGAPWRLHPAPPACPPGAPLPLGLRSRARPACALNLEEPRRTARAGDWRAPARGGPLLFPF